MTKSLRRWCAALWPARPDPNPEDAAEMVLIVFPRCC